MLSELATGNNRSGPVSSPVQLFASRQARIARRELARASHESPHTDALHPVRRGARRHGAQHALLSHRATPLGRSFRVTHVPGGFLPSSLKKAVVPFEVLYLPSGSWSQQVQMFQSFFLLYNADCRGHAHTLGLF